MKKLFFFACLVASVAVWAEQPRAVVRAYANAGGGYVLLDENNEVMAFTQSGTVQDCQNSLKAVLASEGLELQVMTANAPQLSYTLSDSVGPLLKDIAFSQGAPYNTMTPLDDSGKRCVTGCVATAMAQIMAYHKHPQKCNASVVSYTVNNEYIMSRTLTIDYDTVSFDWSLILDHYPYPMFGTDAQRMEIGKLMWACGVASHMNYTSKSSGTSSTYVPGAFFKQFNYAKGLRFEDKEDFIEAEFIQALIDEFDAGRPVYASAQYNGDDPNSFDGGHAFVIDGYAYAENDTQHKKPYFHFNWGWNGTDQIGNRDLWYRLSGSTDKSPYTSGLQIVRGIEPSTSTADEQVTMDGKDNRIFDILGREVHDIVPGQLYIRGGKKFIAR